MAEFIVDEFNLKFWNSSFYARVRFPDGQIQELKSVDDLTFSQWQDTKITPVWDAIQNPPTPPEPIPLDGATTEEIAAEIRERGLTAEDLGL